jgi:hypothetical protein
LRDCGNGTTLPHAETGGESGFAAEGLRRLRATFLVAQEMGEGVGRGQVLLRPVPEGAEVIAIAQGNSPLRMRILFDTVKDPFACVLNP